MNHPSEQDLHLRHTKAKAAAEIAEAEAVLAVMKAIQATKVAEITFAPDLDVPAQAVCDTVARIVGASRVLLTTEYDHGPSDWDEPLVKAIFTFGLSTWDWVGTMYQTTLDGSCGMIPLDEFKKDLAARESAKREADSR